MADDVKQGLAEAVSLQGLLGYLNFSEGKPDPRFQKQINDAYAFYLDQERERPWEDLHRGLVEGLETLRQGGSSAFRDVGQAQAVLGLVFERVLPAYRDHHRDLLAHQTEAILWQPFFLARTFEATLAQRGPWDEVDRIVRGALKQLNDFVGHRPIAVLEGRQRGEPYDHEALRPIPLYLRGAGVASGRYRNLIHHALEILRKADPAILNDASFDLDRLDELALDPRGYDFDHPVDKRPNYIFGEWDPHQIDNRGYYRRFVVRQITLDGLLHRIRHVGTSEGDEYLLEAAAVLACTMLMASGVSGTGPTAYDSTVTLNNLVPRIAQYREAFYGELLETWPEPQRSRLIDEAKQTRQPFGGARQHLNRFVAQERARHVQQRHLAILLADIGYPASSRRQIANVSVASVRLLTEMHILLTAGHLAIEQGKLEIAARNVTLIEDLLRRGIACGALADPWNILGFQGHFPRFFSLEDSIRDPRIEPLLRVVDRLFSLFARLLSEGAASGSYSPDAALSKEMRRLAEWWDAFATTTVSDLPRVHGGDATDSALQVAQALTRWRERGSASADLAFWREHLEHLRTPKAFALVVDALLRKQDYRAALSLLMTWLSHHEEAPLEEGEFSFHHLALRWMLGVCALANAEAEKKASATAVPLVTKFFDFLEANAEDFAQAPKLNLLGTTVEGQESEELETVGEEGPDGPDDDEETSLYGAAYEDMTYKDSTDDDVEAEVLDFLPQKDFDLTTEAERLEKQLRFVATLARLWNIATRALRDAQGSERKLGQEALRGWLAKARKNYQGLLLLLDAVHEHEVPKPSGAYDSIVEFDQRRITKERLLGLIVTTCLDAALAVGALRGVLDREAQEDGPGPTWEPWVIRLERALLRKDPAQAAKLLPELIKHFRNEPLLYTPLTHGGHPRQILRASIAQTILRGLVANLPRQGLLLETYRLVRLAHTMEQNQPLSGPRVTEYDRLFQLAVQAVTEALAEAAQRGQIGSDRFVSGLEPLMEPFLHVWMEHSKTLRVAVLEAVGTEKEWQRLRDFIRKYGRDLFQARFMALGNLRGILHRGVGPYLDYLLENPDPLRPIRLLDDLDRSISRQEAERWLQLILQTVIENYDHYRDYNSTTTQSDYGENLYQLFDFLRLKASYERNAWQLKPLALVHETLARKHPLAAALWRQQVQQLCKEAAEQHLAELNRLEKTHGMRLATIADRLQERFVQPLAIDGVCALIETALAEAPRHLESEETIPLERALESFTANPTGVGLDVPHWILRLEGEVQRVRTSKTALVNLAETLFQVPRVPLSFDKLGKQLKGWRDIEE